MGSIEDRSASAGTNGLGGPDDSQLGPEGKFFSQNIVVLIQRIASIGALQFQEELAEMGLTIWNWRVLAALLEEENVRLSDLAEVIRAEISTLSRVVSAMERNNLISRQYRTEGDGRALNIGLTPAGRALAMEIYPKFRRYSDMYLDGLSANDRERLKEGILRVYGNIVAARSPKRRRSKSAGRTRRR